MTPRQEEIRAFLLDFGGNHGRWPTLSEASDHFEISKAGVQHHLQAMERKGIVQREKAYARWELTGFRFKLISN